jgi:outer membrane lipoprotein carrier protein
MSSLKINKIAITFLIILLFNGLNKVYSQERKELSKPSQIEISKKLNTLTGDISSIQADFTQEKVFSFMEDKLRSEGKFWFVAPNKIRWQYEKPYPYTVIMNDGKMQVNDDGDKYSMDMRSNQLFKQMNTLITESIQGKLLTEGDDYKQQFYEDSANYIVSFSPKDKNLKAYLKTIEIYFSKENGQVQALKMIESAGDYTFIKFDKRIENKSISDNIFK